MAGILRPKSSTDFSISFVFKTVMINDHHGRRLNDDCTVLLENTVSVNTELFARCVADLKQNEALNISFVQWQNHIHRSLSFNIYKCWGKHPGRRSSSSSSSAHKYAQQNRHAVAFRTTFSFSNNNNKTQMKVAHFSLEPFLISVLIEWHMDMYVWQCEKWLH